MHDPDLSDCNICKWVREHSTPAEMEERRAYFREVMAEVLLAW